MASMVPLEVKVWGEFACFTRPEMKTERVSYPIITPSAARGILEAIFWKPQFTWVVREIHVLRPIQYVSILRNEISEWQKVELARRWAAKRSDMPGFDRADNKKRVQRHTLALRDVSYIIRGDMKVHPEVTTDVAGYRDQFRRRVRRGACFSQPFLGCREFTAFFGESDATERPIAVSGDFGQCLLDIEYSSSTGEPRRAHFFNAQLENGILHIPRFTLNGKGGK